MRLPLVLMFSVASGLAALAACYDPALDPCRISCADDVPCPGALVCGADQRCHVAGDTAACAATDDGGVDAAVVAGQYRALAVGDEFACAIGADAEIYCWGINFVGQLGDGTTLPRATPGRIDEPGPWRALGAGEYHACGVKESGALFCWGIDAYGQVDGVDGEPEPTPVEVEHPGGRTWTKVAAGEYHTCAIDDAAELLCWGAGDDGALGRAVGAGAFAPAAIPGHTGWVELTAADRVTCGRKDDGRGWCWGTGPIGQPGDFSGARSDVPVEIAGDLRFRSLSANRTQGCGVTTAGELRCWGDNQIGELGDATTTTPDAALPGADWQAVFAGRYVTCATRTTTASLTCFGDQREGQLGTGERRVTDEVELPFDARIVAAETGRDFTCALDEAGTIWCFGRDDHGQCGDGVADDRFLDPTAPLAGLDGETIVELSGRFWHTCARAENGRLWCWGDNAGGQVGDGTRVDRATPFEVPQQGGPWRAVSTSSAHTCAIADLDPTDRVYCWGDDTAGQLGNGGGPSATTPVAVTATGATFTALGGGALFTCALDTNSERWCWGNNSNAELGAGSVDGQHPSPELIADGPAGWRVVDGAMSYGCGIATDDTLWCWGANQFGQLGIGAGPTQVAPQQVGGATDWYQLAVDAQVGATCGIRDDAGDGGALYCWGNNDNYQLGTGDQTSHETPFEIVGRQWLRIDLGSANACGIDASGALLCWGSNRSLQTADDPYRDHVGTIPSTSPWPGATPEHLAVGYEHTCAVEGGQVYCWGDGSYGQLGDGNRATRLPRAVIAPP